MRDGTSFKNVEVQMEQPNGNRIWIMVSIEPLRDASGTIVGAINCFQDVTAHKLAQQRKFQIDEVNHRMKNVIATVRSLATNTLKNTPAAEAAKALDDRLLALMHAHDLLARRNWEGLNLYDLVRDVAEPFCSGRLHFDGPRVGIAPEFGVSLALAIQELATNAIKYGALSQAGGSISLKWNVTGDEDSRSLVIHWVESTSFTVQEPSRRGFGTLLVERMLAYQHRAEVRISYPPEGFRCEIVVPL